MTKQTYQQLEAKIAELEGYYHSQKRKIEQLENTIEAVNYCFQYKFMEECQSLKDVEVFFETREDNDEYMADQADLYQSTFENRYREGDL